MARRQILDGRCAVVDRPASPFRAALPPTLFADNLPVAHQPVENDVDSKLSVGGSNRDGAPFLARMRPIERHRPVRAPIDPYRKPRSKALTRVSFRASKPKSRNVPPFAVRVSKTSSAQLLQRAGDGQAAHSPIVKSLHS